jgi:hypothetical protein
MLRQTMLGSIAAALLAPALLVTASAAPARAAEDHHEWGAIAADDGKLRKGCRKYSYDYAIAPPEGDWRLETFLVDPRGETLASHHVSTGLYPLTGTRRFKICQAVTTTGRFEIRGLLTVQNGPNETVTGWIQPAVFKLRKR